MSQSTHDSRFWSDLRERMNAEQARLKARYEEATRRHHAVLAALLGFPEPVSANAAPGRRFFGVPLRSKRRAA